MTINYVLRILGVEATIKIMLHVAEEATIGNLTNEDYNAMLENRFIIAIRTFIINNKLRTIEDVTLTCVEKGYDYQQIKEVIKDYINQDIKPHVQIITEEHFKALCHLVGLAIELERRGL